jgi:hypothetical protein
MKFQFEIKKRSRRGTGYPGLFCMLVSLSFCAGRVPYFCR